MLTITTNTPTARKCMCVVDSKMFIKYTKWANGQTQDLTEWCKYSCSLATILLTMWPWDHSKLQNHFIIDNYWTNKTGLQYTIFDHHEAWLKSSWHLCISHAHLKPILLFQQFISLFFNFFLKLRFTQNFVERKRICTLSLQMKLLSGTT